MPGRSASNLMELAIVIVMLTLVASIAIPRMSRGAAAVHETALLNSLRDLRDALERYARDHGGTYPAAGHVTEALTSYSNASGTIFLREPDAALSVTLGPYLRAVPPLPVNAARRGARGIAPADADGVGWIYSVNSAGVGQIHANTTIEADAFGLRYNAY